MPTIRAWLTKAGFNFKEGIIVYHPVSEDHCPGYDDYLIDGRYISMDHKILDTEFSDDYGGPECPRFIAKDRFALYFPSQYDGATSIEKVYLDLNKYVGNNKPTPYPGG